MPATMHYTENKTKPATDMPLKAHIKEVMSNYYKTMAEQGDIPENVYSLIISEAEIPLIEATMEYAKNNQSLSASVLGINRGTFRKKLATYGI